MNQKDIIRETEHFMRVHIPWKRPEDVYIEHILGVRRYGLKLARLYNADPFVVEMAALLHDTGAYVGEDHAGESATIARHFLPRFSLPESKLSHIVGCIKNHSIGSKPENLEEQIIQDADGITFLRYDVQVFYQIQEQKLGKAEGKKVTLTKVKGMMGKINTDQGKELAKPFYTKALTYLENLR
jgi:HD superfamily phosphodiesterase